MMQLSWLQLIMVKTITNNSNRMSVLVSRSPLLQPSSPPEDRVPPIGLFCILQQSRSLHSPSLVIPLHLAVKLNSSTIAMFPLFNQAWATALPCAMLPEDILGKVSSGSNQFLHLEVQPYFCQKSNCHWLWAAPLDHCQRHLALGT